MSPRRTVAAAARAGLVVALALPSAGCGEQVVVRVTTRVEPQGGISRKVEVIGRETDGTRPKKADWLAETARVQLASRSGWSRVDEAPGYLVAEGFFRRIEDVPPTLAHRRGTKSVADHLRAELEIQNLVVLERWVYRETIGDPYGPAEISSALDALVSLAALALRGELRRTLGERVDPAPAESFLRNDVRSLIADLLPVLREERSLKALARGATDSSWKDILRKHDVPVARDADTLLSDAQIERASSWLRARIAKALSTRERPISPEELAFWPGGDDEDEELEAIANRAFGGMDELTRRAEPILAALAGSYGEASGPVFRFESRLDVPGTLLRTNGTPERGAVVWFYRDEDLMREARVLEAESVELRDEPLRSLGARRELDTVQLLQLADLLTLRDPEGALRKLLVDAVEAGELGLLRDDSRVPAEILLEARELADLLDPSVEIDAAP